MQYFPRLSLAAVLFACLFNASVGADSPNYRVSATYQVGGSGRWDYLSVDSEHQLLFVPRVTHTMVLDALTGTTVADIPGQKHNHGVALVPGAGRGFISDGDDASVVVFDLKNYQILGKIKAAPDADAIIYDRTSNKILLVSGDAGALIPISPDLDPAKDMADPQIDLNGKPEGIAPDGHGRVYICLADKNEVAVVDVKARKVLSRWSTAPGGTPVGMSIDRERRRLYVGCRNPQKMIVMNADDGTILADLPIGAGCDGTRFDGYGIASCGDGTMTIVGETSPGKFEVVQSLATRFGARTLGLDAKKHIMYLPTADFLPAVGNARPVPKPGTFMIVVVSR